MTAPHTICLQTCALYCGDQPSFDTFNPPTLEKIVLRALTSNIQDWCPWLLQALGPDHLSSALEELSLELPLSFCVRNVPDGFYWQRRALTRWPDPARGMCDVTQHGGSWRRLLLERHLQELLENVAPYEELPIWLKTELRDAAPHVCRLVLRQMKAAVKFGHLPLGPVICLLPELQELCIKTGPRDCGLDFSWTKFTLSTADAQSLQGGLASAMNLQMLKIHSSHLSDETLELLLHETSLARLIHLDLSHNELQDRSADTLVQFVTSHSNLKVLRIVNNRMGSDAAEKLSKCLENSGLKELELSLNALGETGGTALVQKCKNLQVLRLAGCALGLETIQTLASHLCISDLRTIDLSNNNLSEEAGAVILDCLGKRRKSKFHLTEFDLRMTGITEVARQNINKVLSLGL